MSQLFSPVRIGKLELENRIVIAPMCQYSADNGKATAWHRIHLGQLAFSGAGLLIIEASAVEPAGRITPADMGLWDDETEAALQLPNAKVNTFADIHKKMKKKKEVGAGCYQPHKRFRKIPKS